MLTSTFGLTKMSLSLINRLFFVIEFVRGGDLMFHMQRQRRLPEEHARLVNRRKKQFQLNLKLC